MLNLNPVASRRLRQAAFEVIAESLPHMVWMAAADGSTDYFNRRGTAYTGLAPQANYGWGWLQLVHPEDALYAQREWEHSAATASPFEVTYRVRRSDGLYRWHLGCGAAVCGNDGEVIKWIGAASELPDSGVSPPASERLAMLIRSVQVVAREGLHFRLEGRR